MCCTVRWSSCILAPKFWIDNNAVLHCKRKTSMRSGWNLVISRSLKYLFKAIILSCKSKKSMNKINT